MYQPVLAPNDTAYKWWSGHKLLCNLCKTFPPDLPICGQASLAEPLDGWRCFSQKRVMSRLIQVRQHHTNVCTVFCYCLLWLDA